MDAARVIKSGLFHEFLFAAGAGDANGALTLGNLDLGFAARALEIAIIFPTLDPGKELGKFLIFRISLGHISGKGAVQSQHQGDICQQLKDGETGKGADEIENNAQNEKKPAQLIDAVSSGHKANHGGTETL